MHEKATGGLLETCELVHASGLAARVPAAMGTPRPDQLQGSALDQLIELAGRVCYDSLGGAKGRNSLDYHAHINQTRHHSTHEHANLTVEVGVTAATYGHLLECLVGRPGLHLERKDVTPFPLPPAEPSPYEQWLAQAARAVPAGRMALLPPPERPAVQPAAMVLARLTLNLRTIREWDSWTPPGTSANPFRAPLGVALARLAAREAPLAAGDLASRGGGMAADLVPSVSLAVPVSDGEAWASLHFGNVSRGLSHELVRHGDWTAISQRSTRFVDESEGEWVPHPLIGRDQGLLDQFMAARDVCRPAYDRLVEGLQKEMKARGVDGTAARKQARGAARGVLGNALETQLVFSANVRQWKWMVQKRCSHAADAEIRVAFACALRLLKKAMPARFAGGDWDLLPAKDGIGEVVRCED